MGTHDDNPCWDAHCAPHLTHHDAATRELIARAEARGAERERARILRVVESLPTTRTRAWDKGWDSVSLADVLDALAECRDERPAPEHSEGCREWMDAAPGQRGCVCSVWNKGRPNHGGTR